MLSNLLKKMFKIKKIIFTKDLIKIFHTAIGSKLNMKVQQKIFPNFKIDEKKFRPKK